MAACLLKNSSLLLLPLLYCLSTAGFAQTAEPAGSNKTASATYNPTDKDSEFLSDLMQRSFNYFVEQADTQTGLVHDRAQLNGAASKEMKGGVASSAATGFGLAALCIGAKHGWVSTTEALIRAQRTVQFLVEKSTVIHGWFYHFTDPSTGERAWNSEVSSIDTGLLLAGALTAKGCFKDEKLSLLVNRLYSRIDYKWMASADSLRLSHGWYPETGQIPVFWDSYSEHLLLNLLSIGAPNNQLAPESWTAWRRDMVKYAPYEYVSANAPLFVHQYSHAFFDFRGVNDTAAPGENLFENSVIATRAHKQFCLDISTKFPSYTENSWGITASDASEGRYIAWGGPPAHPDIDGTVVPCAAGGSLMFTPEISLPALKEIKKQHGNKIWGHYGFTDAFNPITDWASPDVIGINVGIILLSAENMLSGSVWKWFMSNPEPNRAMTLTGLKK